jgi:hypothetical protein
MKADASYSFAPLDVAGLRFLQEHWDKLRLGLAGNSISDCDIFSGHHFNYGKFESFLQHHGLEKAWPRTEKSCVPCLDKDTWEMMCGLRPELETVHQLYKTMTMPGLNVACDPDGRNRMLLGAFGAITSRNTPGNDDRGRFIFGLPKCWRFLIKPPEGRALAYIDWSCQEYGIAAVLSGDENMLRSYETGDPYIKFAILAGATPEGATKDTHPAMRKLYKSATLAIGYGQGSRAFSEKTGVNQAIAESIFRQYQRVYSRFWRWRDEQVDRYAINLQLETKLGWTLHRGVRVKQTTVLNFTAQTTGAEMLRLAVIEMMHAGVQVCCPVHDAVLIEAPVDGIESAIRRARVAMDTASALLLDGYVLRIECSDKDITRDPARFFDKDGKETWDKIVNVANGIKGHESPFATETKNEQV